MKKTHAIRVIPVVTLLALVTAMLAPFVLPARAATLSNAKDTIGTSQPGVASSHSFVFTPSSTTAIKTIDFQFCNEASGTCTAPNGMVLTSAPQLGTVSGIDGTTYTASATDTNCTGSGNTNCTATLTVGSPTTQTVTAINVPFLSGITNPTGAGAPYYVRITTKDGSSQTIDTNTVAFAILTAGSVSMTASVDPTLAFSLAAVTSGSVNSSVINVTTGTGADVIPFGSMTSGAPKIAAHDISVTTNAVGGYVVTASASAAYPLADGSNHFNAFSGTNASPATWTSPAGGTANTNTGFVGYTTEETGLTGGTATRFSGNLWAGLTNSPDPIISSTDPTGASARTVRVGWQAEVNELQPPSPNYTGTVILVATPTY